MQALVEIVIKFLDKITSIFSQKLKKDSSNMVHLPDHALLTGIICIVVFSLPTIFLNVFSSDSKMWFVTAIMLVFALLGAALIIAYFNCRIEFGENEFIYKSFFGVKKTIQYRDLDGILYGGKDLKLFSGDTTVYVMEDAVNKERFIAVAKKEYANAHKGKKIPKSTKKDIFNNHVEDPQSIILAYTLLFVFFVLLTLGIATVKPERREAFESRSVTVAKYEIDDKNLILYDSNGEEYRVFRYESTLEDKASFIADLSEGERYTMSVMLVNGRHEDYYKVSEIESEGDIHLTYERWYEAQQRNQFETSLVFIGVDILFLAFILATIYVGRNPHKFSDKVLHFFFKPGTIQRDC